MIKKFLSLQSILDPLQNIIAPPRCMGCLQENTWLCRPCRLNKPPFTLTCIICKEKSIRGTTCKNCLDATPLRGMVNAGHYGYPVLRRGIHWLKFKNVKSVAFPLSRLLIMPLLEIAPLPLLQKSAVLIPIPLHYRKQNQRGFNQSLLIAYHISELTQIPTCDILHRQKQTLTQTQLPIALREQNTAGAFELKDEIPAAIRFIIIFDDVTTSGSTITSAAKCINAKPHQEIWGLTLAKG